MNSQQLDLILKTVAPRLKLRLAQLESWPTTPEQDQQLERWLKSLPVPIHVADEPISEFGVSLTADWQRLTWRAAGVPEAFIPRMADYFVDMGATQAELERLSLAGAGLQPEQLGYWLEARPGNLNAGWYFPVEMPLPQALAQIDAGRPRQVVERWAKEYGLETCARLGRAIGGGNPFSEMRIHFPIDDIEEQVYIGLQLFERLQVQLPPDDVLELLLTLEHGGLGVALWLTATGVIKTGLTAAQPRTMLVLELCRAAGVKNYDALAAFEGILMVEGPIYVETQSRAIGFGIEMHYNIGSETLLTFPGLDNGR